MGGILRFQEAPREVVSVNTKPAQHEQESYSGGRRATARGSNEKWALLAPEPPPASGRWIQAPAACARPTRPPSPSPWTACGSWGLRAWARTSLLHSWGTHTSASPSLQTLSHWRTQEYKQPREQKVPASGWEQLCGTVHAPGLTLGAGSRGDASPNPILPAPHCPKLFSYPCPEGSPSIITHTLLPVVLLEDLMEERM